MWIIKVYKPIEGLHNTGWAVLSPLKSVMLNLICVCSLHRTLQQVDLSTYLVTLEKKVGVCYHILRDGSSSS